ncbi:hypothetical protein BC629DRAFT_1293449, partial [Irpex lacteus]
MPITIPDCWTVQALRPVRLTWAAERNGVRHRCPHCHIDLLTGEDPGFCCGPRGSRVDDVPPLPALPPEYDAIIHDPQISSLSRKLNLLFSFAAMESTVSFPNVPAHDGFVAVEGKIYHRVRPDHQSSPIKWLIYDGFHPSRLPRPGYADVLKPQWTLTIQHVLLRVNPFVRALMQLGSLNAGTAASAHVVLRETTAPELAACLSFENTSLSE